MFADMTGRISMDTLSRIFKIQIKEEESVKKQHTQQSRCSIIGARVRNHCSLWQGKKGRKE